MFVTKVAAVINWLAHHYHPYEYVNFREAEIFRLVTPPSHHGFM
jgi:hypothetical protein